MYNSINLLKCHIERSRDVNRKHDRNHKKNKK